MHMLERLPRETGRDYALRVLKDNIIRLELEPGSMVSENELASILGISRTPVREALIELSKVYIVEIYPQKGSRIALIDSRLVEQSYFLRETLECEVIKEVCRTVTEAGLLKLRTSLQEQALFSETGTLIAGTDETISFMELDNQFHRLLYEIAGKEMIYHLIQETLIHFDRVRNLTITYMKPKGIISQHEDILKAIEERDEYLAAALIRKHLNHFRNIKQELYDEHPGYFSDGL
ncbi:MAG: GntR family transcriptional regulator [Blautia sp.]|nr:GntR family transcriptional regulator [Blautia sp.]